MDFLFVKIMKVNKKYPVKRKKLKKIESSVISTSMLLMEIYHYLQFLLLFIGWEWFNFQIQGKGRKGERATIFFWKYTTIFNFCCFSLGGNSLTSKFRGKEGGERTTIFFGNITLSLIFVAFHRVGIVELPNLVGGREDQRAAIFTLALS